MELRSGRRLRLRSPPPPPPRPHGITHRPHRSTDLLSSLPDEMLLLVLARLRCFRTAVQTSVLSRRWRGLWISLTHLAFRGLQPTRIESLFRHFNIAPPQVVSTLDIHLPWTWHSPPTADANSLLRASLRLSPQKLLFTFQSDIAYNGDIELPCFPDTTWIELDTGHFGVKPLLTRDEFTALDTLSIKGKITDLVPLLSRCPRLRVLTVTCCPAKHLLRVITPAHEFPMLEKLCLSAGRIVDFDSLLDRCRRLRVLSVTQLDTSCLLRITPPGEFPMLENLSLSGNIVDLGILLNQCPRLRVLGVTFRGMTLGSLEEGLTALEEAAPLGLVLRPLGMEIPRRDDDSIDATFVTSLLRRAARLSPQELVFTDNSEGCSLRTMFSADLPCFPTATSIQLTLNNVCFTPLPSSEFSALERLSLQCGIVDIGTLVTCCPCLRVLKATLAMGKITVHSSSLRELHLSSTSNLESQGIDIVSPMLKHKDIDVSILAPLVENFSWKRSYTSAPVLVFGSWLLRNMSVKTKERSYTCWEQLPRSHAMSLYLISAGNHLDAELNFAQEMEKLPITNISELELNFETAWHVYGALVMQLLGMCSMRTATKKLKVILPWWPKAREACQNNCWCDKPKNWRRQSIFYACLEEVEIQGFNGEDHEHDFLTLILKYSPMLKQVIVRPSETYKAGCTTQLSNIFLAHPSVKYYWCSAKF